MEKRSRLSPYPEWRVHRSYGYCRQTGWDSAFLCPLAYAVMHRIFTECVLRIRDWRVTLMKRKEWEKRMSPFHVTIVKRLKHTNRQTDMETGTWLSKPQQGAYLPQSDGLFLQAP